MRKYGLLRTVAEFCCRGGACPRPRRSEARHRSLGGGKPRPYQNIEAAGPVPADRAGDSAGRRWGTASGAIATLALAAVVACSGGSGSGYNGPPVIVLGFDGMDYGLTRQLMAEGRMPNFTRLAEQGSFGPLGTAVPPQSPVAWSNFITGQDSGGHGIFDFVHREPDTLAPYFSTSRAEDPKTLKILAWEIPMGGGSVELLRRGQEFWEILEQNGVESHIYRMPANYPPSGTATRELSGMGTPDLLGSAGTFSFYTSDLFVSEDSVDGGDIYPVDLWDNKIEGELYAGAGGRADRFATDFSAYIDPETGWVELVIEDNGEKRLLKVGEWSDWVPIDFKLSAVTEVRGMARFLVQSLDPEFELYVSPINIDPMKPEQPISTPDDFAAELARATGRFYTQGMMEDTKALTAEVFSYEEFLAQAKIAGDEILEQYEHVLADFGGDFLFYYFGNLDQVSHMMFHTLDPEHPAYDPEVDGPYADSVPSIYEEFDGIVGYTLDNMPEDARLIVMSDHGFASWRRTFHLNTWLAQEGYLVLKDPGLAKSNIYSNVDWSKTRAYGLGLNGLYINLAGREPDGSVRPEDFNKVADDLARELLAVVDPATGQPAITKVYRADRTYRDSEYLAIGPDLQVGYAKGVRCSGSSALGDIQTEVITDNTDGWGGDHCMDHETVPGILLTNVELERPATDLLGLSATVLAEFGIDTEDTNTAGSGGTATVASGG